MRSLIIHTTTFIFFFVLVFFLIDVTQLHLINTDIYKLIIQPFFIICDIIVILCVFSFFIIPTKKIVL